MSNELITINEQNPLEVFQPDKVSDIIDRVRKEVELFVGDPSTEKGRAEIASFAMKIRKTKTGIDTLGKNLVADWKEKSKAVDAERKRVRDELDKMIEDTYRPVQEFKDREAKRVAEHEESINWINQQGFVAQDHDSSMIRQTLNELKTFYENRDWQEFEIQAKSVFETSLNNLQTGLTNRIAYEANQRELEELRKKAAEEDQRRREADIAKKAAEEAERRVRDQAEREKQELIDMARKAEEDKERAIQAERDRQAEEKRREDQAKADAERAEQQRIADENHRANIHVQIGEGLMEVLDNCIDVDTNQTDWAIAIGEAIIDGKIPHVIVKY